MDERPKRNRDRYNPYYLDRDRKREIYKISIESDTQKISIYTSEDVYMCMDELERKEANQIQWDKRYLEKSDLTENTLHRRAVNTPKSAEDDAINKIYHEKLNRAIKKLSPMHRRRILLYFEHNLSFSEIAEVEGCSKMAIKYSIDIALKQLRKYMNIE